MLNFSSYTRLKQRCAVVGGVLVAIAITAYSAPAKSQLPSANTPAVANSSLSSSPAPVSGSPTQSIASATPIQQAAVQAIRDYYSAISSQDYRRAYSAWDRNGAASQQSFEQFKQGFANTASTAVEVGTPGRLDGATGSSYIKIPVTVSATTTTGTPQRFRGSYILRRVNGVSGSNPEQRGWHLYSANLTQVN
ncbi:MAG: hypothetical protein V7K94_31170 [Nostoc sp.]|uniref:hypothetical protein n=1 Tax=Nostoc sp. TaxID=1180 RepID=UPI002FF89D7B